MKKFLIPKKFLFFAGVGAILLFILRYFNIAIFPLVCPFRAITGIPCPGCGITRALYSIVMGDFKSAFSFNPFSFFLIFWVFVSLTPQKYIQKIPYSVEKFTNHFLILVLFSLLVFWIFRIV